MIWFFLWLVIAAAVFVAYILSAGVDLKQARAWKAFADKTGLTFVQKGFLQPPAVIGRLNGYDIRLYTMIEDNKDQRRKIVWSFAEIDLKGGPAAPFVISRRSYPGLFDDAVGQAAELDGIPARIDLCENPQEVSRFFSGDRLAALQEMWRWEGYQPIALCTASACSLAVSTGEALSHPKQVQETFKSLIAWASALDQGHEQ